MSNGDPDSPQRVASQLIERSGILERTKIITQLNLERGKDQSTFDEILTAIAADRPLAERIIHLANSAWFGGRVKVDSVPVAFGRLGTQDFHKAAIAAALRFDVGDGNVKSKWWLRSETVAHNCEVMARHLNPGLVEHAFQLGLLHDCAVPFMTAHVTDYSYLADDALGHSPQSVEMELECNQTDHCSVGAMLVQAWKFPATYAPVVLKHHSQSLACVDRGETRQLLGILLSAMRADSVTANEAEVFDQSDSEQALLREVASAFDVSIDKLSEVLAEMLRLYRLRSQTGG